MSKRVAADPSYPSTDREATLGRLQALAREVRLRDSAVAHLLERLAAALAERRHDEARGYAGAIDPRAIAELLVGGRSLIWGVFEVARSVLVFAPIAVTWYGLSLATDAYAHLIAARPDLLTRPFLLLWQEGFEGRIALNFSTVAAIDAALIALLIALSFVIHVRADVRDAATRARLLLKESEIRSLVGHVQGLASVDIDPVEADELLDRMVAEERRIYERAMEREQQLFELERAVSELRSTVERLSQWSEAREKEAARPGEGAGPARASEGSPSGFPSPSPGRPSFERDATKTSREALAVVRSARAGPYDDDR